MFYLDKYMWMTWPGRCTAAKPGWLEVDSGLSGRDFNANLMMR